MVHPPMYPGVNTAVLAGDELNGGGINSTVYMDLIDAQALALFAITQSDMFSHVDALVHGERNLFSVGREDRTFKVWR